MLYPLFAEMRSGKCSGELRFTSESVTGNLPYAIKRHISLNGSNYGKDPKSNNSSSFHAQNYTTS